MDWLLWWAAEIVRRWEYVGVFALTLLENVFPPLPSDLIIPLAGFVTLRGELDLIGTIAAASGGSLAGAAFWYVLGRRIGETRVLDWLSRHGRWLTIRARDLDRAQSW